MIGEGRAFNINTPLLKCPNDITSSNPIVSFQAFTDSSFTLSYSHQPNTSFPAGQKTTVTVRSVNRALNINLQCTFTVDISASVGNVGGGNVGGGNVAASNSNNDS